MGCHKVMQMIVLLSFITSLIQHPQYQVGSYYFTDTCKLRKSEDIIDSELDSDFVNDQVYYIARLPIGRCANFTVIG